MINTPTAADFIAALMSDNSAKQERLQRAISELDETQDQDILKSLLVARAFLRGSMAAYREVQEYDHAGNYPNA